MEGVALEVNLPVNRLLLDPNFDGYKLSLESLPSYKIDLNKGVDESRLSNNQYSYQHIKALGSHNHLFFDPYNDGSVCFVNSAWEVCFHDNVQELPGELWTAWTIPDDSGKRSNETNRHNVTLHFPHESWALLADGAGSLYLLHTGNRVERRDWQLVLSESLLHGKCFSILHSSFTDTGNCMSCDCLLLHIDSKEPGSSEEKSAFRTVLEWVTLTSEGEQGWKIGRRRTLEGASAPDYAALPPGGSAVLLASEKPFKFTEDSAKPVVQATNGIHKNEDPPPAYTWCQSHDIITVTFTVAGDVAKADVNFELKPDNLCLSVKGSDLISGQLQSVVKVDESTWTLEGQKLEVYLTKALPEPWSTLMPADTRGQQVVDPEEAARVHEQLAHLTSESLDSGGDGQRNFNVQQLEECDAALSDNATLVIMDGEAHSTKHQVNLGGHQILFTAPAPKLPIICLRHDVDGLVWQPAESHDAPQPWQHIATFNAFGYVQASKTNKKYGTCSPSFSFAAIADCIRHIYIYRQPSPIAASIRNRNTGRQVSTVARQQVFSLDNAEAILGLQATNKKLYILQQARLYIVRVN